MDQEGRKETDRIRNLVETAGKENPFTVPENYFSELEGIIKSQASLEMRKAATSEIFTVPENYFDELQQRINKRIPVAKVTRMRTWISYAAAACVTVVIGSALYMNLSKPDFEQQLEAIPEEEIISYLQNNSDSGDTELIMDNLAAGQETPDAASGLTDKELQEYLNSTLQY